jgi:hypothetical protein
LAQAKLFQAVGLKKWFRKMTLFPGNTFIEFQKMITCCIRLEIIKTL